MLKLIRAIWCCSIHHRQSVRNLFRRTFRIETVVVMKYPSTLLPRNFGFGQRFLQLFTKNLQFSIFHHREDVPKNILLYYNRKNRTFSTCFSKIFSENLKNQSFVQNLLLNFVYANEWIKCQTFGVGSVANYATRFCPS